MTVTTAQVSKAAHSAYTETGVQDETGRVRQLAVRTGHNHDVARTAADLGRAWEVQKPSNLARLQLQHHLLELQSLFRTQVFIIPLCRLNY